ncbi:MAG: hypothetical protein H7A25_21665 [Leptospiraceae bacterium]|nr:hypothetical protein [Leptospiraceae bacterium]
MQKLFAIFFFLFLFALASFYLYQKQHKEEKVSVRRELTQLLLLKDRPEEFKTRFRKQNLAESLSRVLLEESENRVPYEKSEYKALIDYLYKSLKEKGRQDLVDWVDEEIKQAPSMQVLLDRVIKGLIHNERKTSP